MQLDFSGSLSFPGFPQYDVLVKIGRIFIIAALGVFLILLGREIYTFYTRRNAAYEEYKTLTDKLDASQAENEKLKAELDYLSRPENLEKELRARFNYRQAGEKLIIIVPRATSTASSTP